MRRRSFLKGLMTAAAAVMIPLKLTDFGDMDQGLLDALRVGERPSMLSIESLEHTLRTAVYYPIDGIKVWRAIPKLPEYDPIGEHSRVSGIEPRHAELKEILQPVEGIAKASPIMGPTPR